MRPRIATNANVDLIAARVSILDASTLSAPDLNASMSHVHLVNHASLIALVKPQQKVLQLQLLQFEVLQKFT